MAWRIAESLETLRRQLNAAFPNRSKISDGGIGDARHQSSKSDHNPHIIGAKGIRVVSARDFTHDPKNGLDCNRLAEWLIESRDPRIKYIIWNRRIVSSKTAAWRWRPYSGANAHTKHLHLSVMADAKLYDSAKPWDLDVAVVESKPLDDIARVTEPEKPLANITDKEIHDLLEIEQVEKPAKEKVNNAEPAEKSASIPPENSEIIQPVQPNAETSVEIKDGNVSVQTSENAPPLETKEVVAPEKENSTANSTKLTIAGFAVPTFAVGIVSAIKSAFAEGYVDGKEVFSAVSQFMFQNVKYVFILIGLVIVGMMLKKLYKQITFFMTIWINSKTDSHDVEIVKE